MRDFPRSAALSLKPRHEGRDDAASCDSGHLHVNDPTLSRVSHFEAQRRTIFLTHE